jgi:tetratricopeptide (TPR) repeat protein
MKRSLLFELTVLAFAALFFNSCTKIQQASSPELLKPNATEQPAKPNAANETIRFLEQRVKQNPEDFIAYNKLTSEYLRQMRETGDTRYLDLASRAANASLEILPLQQNKGGLAALVLVKYSMHEFTAARDYAKQLIDLEPNRGYPYQMLGDALLELGQYEEAEAAFKQMEQYGGIQAITQSAMEQRLARLAALKGDLKAAAKHYSNALKLAQSTPIPSPETVAYCQWQSGETAFAGGDYKTAEKFYKDSLKTLPDYPNALASMGRILAARNDLTGAIDLYERVTRRLPDLTFVVVLGDLYKIAGRALDAQRQYELAEQIGRLGELNGTLYNRSLAIFYADHDLKTEEAYRLAAKEYEVRRDVYGADALAWTALKVGKISEAQAAAKEALRLGTKDARLFYHAGMIALAAGDKVEARKHLQSALLLNPKFEPLQAEICRKTLETL